jgi:predicted transcriptional regulator
VVGKARADKPQRMREIARLVETGRHQAKVAEELKITVSAVSRAMRDMRMALAFARKDDSWTDATKHSAVEVTRAWLADHNESLREAPSSDEEG